jgi:hypothetical protein
VTAANVHDSRTLAPLLDAVAPVRTGRRGECVARGVRHRIARRMVEASDRLGRHRGVVERTMAWLARYRRLTIRYERLVAVHRGLLHLACALICWNRLERL